MKKLILVVVIITTTILQNTFAQNKKDIADIKTNTVSKDSTASKDPLNMVLSAYLALKNALANDDAKTASASAKTMLDKIAKVPMDKMTVDQHNVWMKYQKKLSYDATHISEVAELDHDREHFVTLSKNMYAVEKAFNTNTETLYYQFCPMANDGKGAYWVSEKEKISNPYMGKKMPTCGSIKETLKNK